MKQVILFLRGASTYGSKELALAAINTVTHKIGQPVVATYTDGVTTVNSGAITYSKLQSIVAENGAVLGATAGTISAGTSLQGGGALSGSVTIDEFGHVVSTTKASLPTVEESGKVKVEDIGTADFLEAKVITGDANDANNTYAVQVTKEDDALNLSVKIDVIDGGVFLNNIK